MKKLLTLVVLVAGVALFAGCLNKPAVETTTDTTTTEVTTPVVEEVVPTTETTVTTTGTEEVVPTATAE